MPELTHDAIIGGIEEFQLRARLQEELGPNVESWMLGSCLDRFTVEDSLGTLMGLDSALGQGVVQIRSGLVPADYQGLRQPFRHIAWHPALARLPSADLISFAAYEGFDLALYGRNMTPDAQAATLTQDIEWERYIKKKVIPRVEGALQGPYFTADQSLARDIYYQVPQQERPGGRFFKSFLITGALAERIAQTCPEVIWPVAAANLKRLALANILRVERGTIGFRRIISKQFSPGGLLLVAQAYGIESLVFPDDEHILLSACKRGEAVTDCRGLFPEAPAPYWPPELMQRDRINVCRKLPKPLLRLRG